MKIFVCNDFFSNVICSLNIRQYEDLNVDINQFEDTVLRANKKFQNHTSVRAFKENNKDNQLTFESIFMPDIKKRS